MQSLKKALLKSAFFVQGKYLSGAHFSLAFTLLFFSSFALSADCKLKTSPQSVMVSSIIDGDTVRLSDGRKVRLIGVNTPELYSGLRPENGALEAKKFLMQLVEGQMVDLYLGREPYDRYGRVLAYLTFEGKTLSQRLIERGLGFAISVAPNDQLADCLFTAERAPRLARLNLWAKDTSQARHLSKSGFSVMVGKISNIEITSKYRYIELDDRLAVRVPRSLTLPGDISIGKSLEVRGWVVDRRKTLKKNSRFKPFLLSVNDPRHITLWN